MLEESDILYRMVEVSFLSPGAEQDLDPHPENVTGFKKIINPNSESGLVFLKHQLKV